MTITNLSETEIIELQYSLLEELKHKKTNATIRPPNNADDFILQRFQNENGEYESDKYYQCRQLWFKYGCCSYRKLAKKSGIMTHTAISNVAKQYKWHEIKKEAYNLGYNPNKSNVRPKINTNDDSNTLIKRNSSRYTKYHEKVLKRDNVCQCCGTSHDLEVHHPLPFNSYNTLGADPNNGIVLCKDCHSEYHSKYGYKRNANPITLAQFLRDNGKQFQKKLDNTPGKWDIYQTDVIEARIISEREMSLLTHKQIKILWNMLYFKGSCDCIALVHAMNCNKWEDISSDIETLQQRGIVYQPTKDTLKFVMG